MLDSQVAAVVTRSHRAGWCARHVTNGEGPGCRLSLCGLALPPTSIVSVFMRTRPFTPSFVGFPSQRFWLSSSL